MFIPVLMPTLPLLQLFRDIDRHFRFGSDSGGGISDRDPHLGGTVADGHRTDLQDYPRCLLSISLPDASPLSSHLMRR